MRTKKYWDNRFKDFCDKILENEIKCFQLDMDAIKDEIENTEKLYKKCIENDEWKSKKFVLYCYINHELNLLDPIGICYPQIPDEYSSYAWGIVEALMQGKNQFPFQLREQVKDMYDSVHSKLESRVLKVTCNKIIKIINDIYDSLEFVKNIHKDQFSESQFWKKQFIKFQFEVLGKKRKEYASSIIFLKEERNDLIEHREEKMSENYESYIQFLYINHQLNLLDPTNMYYPQFHYRYEKYSWKILESYKYSSTLQFPIETKKIIIHLYEEVGCEWKREQDSIQICINKIQKELTKINK